uniref:Uncharacterized protein n=1 Tax=Moniliophthora roreri TaxID=221103 RepID=A0A0W0G5D7_MONRR
MEASCSYADTTIVFGDLENPSITILGSSGAGVRVEPTRKGYLQAITRVEGSREGGRAVEVQGTRCVLEARSTDLFPSLPGSPYLSPSSPTPTPSSAAAEILENPPPHIAALPPKSTSPVRTEYARTSRKTLLGVFLPAEQGYDVTEDS